jgi:hypothetical protein
MRLVGTTYDAGVLIAVDRGDRAAAARHRRLTDRGIIPTVPAPVLAQAWRGGPQPALSRLLRGCTVRATDEVEARRAGTALARSGTSDVVDATVVVGALDRGDGVVSSDPDDLRMIAAALGRSLVVRAV